jgi:hypothetical protein
MYRKLSAALLGAVPALALTLVPSSAIAHQGHHDGDPSGRHGRDLLRAHLTPSVPTDPAIDGVKPGGLPWIIDRGEVRVRRSGRLDVRIEGLQVPRADGTADNPVPMVDAVVYSGGAQVADSGPMPLSVPAGDARFRVRLALPRGVHDVSVLISPSTAVGAAYIASAVG